MHSLICWYKFKPIKLLLSSICIYKFKPIIYCCLLQYVDIGSNQLFSVAFFHMLINVQTNYIPLNTSICRYQFKRIKLLPTSICWYEFKPIIYRCLLQYDDISSNQLNCCCLQYVDISSNQLNYCLLQCVDISSNQLYTVAFFNVLI